MENKTVVPFIVHKIISYKEDAMLETENVYTLKEAEHIVKQRQAEKDRESVYYAKQKLSGSLLVMVAILLFVVEPEALIWAVVIGALGTALIVTRDQVMTFKEWEGWK